MAFVKKPTANQQNPSFLTRPSDSSPLSTSFANPNTDASKATVAGNPNGPANQNTAAGQQSSWTNLQDYVNASGDKGARMANSILEPVKKSNDDATQALATSEKELGDKIAVPYAYAAPARPKELNPKPVGGSSDQKQVLIGGGSQRIGQDAEKSAQQKWEDERAAESARLAAEAERATQMSNQKYLGPGGIEELDSWKNATSTADKASSDKGLLSGEGGRSTLLRRTHSPSGERYDNGEVSLDEFLGNYAGGDAFRDFQKNSGDSQKNILDAQTRGKAAVDAAKASIDKSNSEWAAVLAQVTAQKKANDARVNPVKELLDTQDKANEIFTKGPVIMQGPRGKQTPLLDHNGVPVRDGRANTGVQNVEYDKYYWSYVRDYPGGYEQWIKDGAPGYSYNGGYAQWVKDGKPKVNGF